MDPDQKISGESVPRLLKYPGVPSRWIYSRLKAELLAFADEFGFSAEGVVDDLRRNFVTLVRDSEQNPRGVGSTRRPRKAICLTCAEPRTFGERETWP